jgi:hypothetical protein
VSGAAWAALAGAANAYTKQRQDATDEQQWQDRYKIMQQSQEDAARARARYMAALEPPKVDSIHTTDESGKPVVQSRQWVAPSDEDIKAGKSGRFEVTGTTPDINFERLDETQRQNDAKNAQAQERLRMQGEVNAARMEAAAARGGAGGTGFSFKDYASAPPEQRALYDRYRRGEDDPNAKMKQMEMEAKQKRDAEARKATLDELKGNPSASDAKRATTLYRNQVTMGADPFASVSGGAAATAPGRPEPLGQFAGGAPKPAASKAPPDGTVLYKGGRKYVVRNGVPVPA